jgi:hypothetical protein
MEVFAMVVLDMHGRNALLRHLCLSFPSSQKFLCKITMKRRSRILVVLVWGAAVYLTLSVAGLLPQINVVSPSKQEHNVKDENLAKMRSKEIPNDPISEVNMDENWAEIYLKHEQNKQAVLRDEHLKNESENFIADLSTSDSKKHDSYQSLQTIPDRLVGTSGKSESKFSEDSKDELHKSIHSQNEKNVEFDEVADSKFKEGYVSSNQNVKRPEPETDPKSSQNLNNKHQILPVGGNIQKPLPEEKSNLYNSADTNSKQEPTPKDNYSDKKKSNSNLESSDSRNLISSNSESSSENSSKPVTTTDYISAASSKNSLPITNQQDSKSAESVDSKIYSDITEIQNAKLQTSSQKEGLGETIVSDKKETQLPWSYNITEGPCDHGLVFKSEFQVFNMQHQEFRDKLPPAPIEEAKKKWQAYMAELKPIERTFKGRGIVYSGYHFFNLGTEWFKASFDCQSNFFVIKDARFRLKFGTKLIT